MNQRLKNHALLIAVTVGCLGAAAAIGPSSAAADRVSIVSAYLCLILLGAVLLIGPTRDDDAVSVIEASPAALIVLDSNRDNLIDTKDPVWKNMHLAVDYDGDGNIGQGESALIGECGVDALEIDAPAGKAWSLHSDGKTKVVKLPSAT